MSGAKRNSDLSIKPKGGRPPIPCDEFLQGSIRIKIHNFYVNREYPTTKALYEQLRTDLPDYPEFKLTTLKKWLKELNFSYAKLNKKPVCN